MVHTKRFLLVDCESLSCAYCILDLLQDVSRTPRNLMRAHDTYLSTIEIAPSKPIIIVGRELINLNAATDGLDLAEEGFPDTVLGLGSKFAVAESNVDTRLEGRIEGFDAVGGQEEDALEVFQESKEDADECVSADVLGLASLCNCCSLAQSIGQVDCETYPEKHLPHRVIEPRPMSERRQGSC